MQQKFVKGYTWRCTKLAIYADLITLMSSLRKQHNQRSYLFINETINSSVFYNFF